MILLLKGLGYENLTDNSYSACVFLDLCFNLHEIKNLRKFKIMNQENVP